MPWTWLLLWRQPPSTPRPFSRTRSTPLPASRGPLHLPGRVQGPLPWSQWTYATAVDRRITIIPSVHTKKPSVTTATGKVILDAFVAQRLNRTRRLRRGGASPSPALPEHTGCFRGRGVRRCAAPVPGGKAWVCIQIVDLYPPDWEPISSHGGWHRSWCVYHLGANKTATFPTTSVGAQPHSIDYVHERSHSC